MGNQDHTCANAQASCTTYLGNTQHWTDVIPDVRGVADYYLFRLIRNKVLELKYSKTSYITHVHWNMCTGKVQNKLGKIFLNKERTNIRTIKAPKCAITMRRKCLPHSNVKAAIVGGKIGSRLTFPDASESQYFPDNSYSCAGMEFRAERLAHWNPEMGPIVHNRIEPNS